jgi:hypothetical protein
VTAVRQERRTLGSRYLNQTLMYPGVWVLTWIKPQGMPWILAAMELESDAADPA